MSVVIFEPCADGHRFAFVHLLAQAYVRDGLPVVLATREQATASLEFGVHINPLLDYPGFSVATLRGPANTHRGYAPWAYLLQMRQLLRRLQAAEVIVPDADRVFVKWTLAAPFLGVPIAMLLVRPPRARRFTPDSRAYLVGWAKTLMAAWCSLARSVSLRRLTLPTGYEPDRPRVMSWLLRKVAPVKDPVPMAGAAASRGAKQPEDETLTVTLAGVITARKGVAPLLIFAAGAAVRLVLAGKLAEDVTDIHRAQMRELARAGRCEVPDRYLTDEELDAYVATSDALVLAYDRRTVSSGILGRAIRLNCPLLVVGGESVIAAFVRASGVGVVVERWNDVAAGLGELALARGATELALAQARNNLDAGEHFAAALRAR